jgi:hypothetical protein
MDKVRKGDLPWTSLDDLHRMILEDLLKDYRIDGLSEEEKIDWAHVWRTWASVGVLFLLSKAGRRVSAFGGVSPGKPTNLSLFCPRAL